MSPEKKICGRKEGRKAGRKATLLNNLKWVWKGLDHSIELSPNSRILISCIRPKYPYPKYLVSFPFFTKEFYAIAKVMSGHYLTLMFGPEWGGSGNWVT